MKGRVSKKSAETRKERAEMKKLSSLLPPHLVKDPKLSTEENTIHSALQYIDQLQRSVLQRIQEGSLPPTALSMLPQFTPCEE